MSPAITECSSVQEAVERVVCRALHHLTILWEDAAASVDTQKRSKVTKAEASGRSVDAHLRRLFFDGEDNSEAAEGSDLERAEVVVAVRLARFVGTRCQNREAAPPFLRVMRPLALAAAASYLCRCIAAMKKWRTAGNANGSGSRGSLAIELDRVMKKEAFVAQTAADAATASLRTRVTHSSGKRQRLRSANPVVDNWLQAEAGGDNFADLEDFLVL